MKEYATKLFSELGVNSTQRTETTVSERGVEHKFVIWSTNEDLIHDILSKCYIADVGKSEKDIKILCGNLIGAARSVTESDFSNVSERMKVLEDRIKEFDKEVFG